MNETAFEKQSLKTQIRNTLIRPSARETAAVWATLAYLLFQLYRTFIDPLPPLILRPIYVAMTGVICCLFSPAKTEGKSAFVKIYNYMLDAVIFCSFPFHIWYTLSQYSRVLTRIPYLDPVLFVDKLECVLLLIMIVGLILRSVGKALTIFCGVFLIYPFVSKWLPGILYYKGMSFE